MSQLQNHIAGQWQLPAKALAVQLCDASTAEPLFAQMESSPEQIENAIAVASDTHRRGVWTGLPAEQRALLLERVAAELSLRGEALAVTDSQSTGVIKSLTSRFALICAAAFKGAAQLVRQPPAIEQFAGPHGNLLVERLPLGPAAIIAPWNAPAGITAHKLASALAAGCPCIIKPSEWAPLSGQIIMQAVEAAGLPVGVCQLLQGTGVTGAALTADSRIAAVSFTGGLAGGRAVAAACAQDIKPAQLELGGNNPLVVLQDANLDNAADNILTAMITLNGQWCRALGRLLIHEAIAEDLLGRVKARLAAVVMGDAQIASSQMGPIVHPGHLAHIKEAVAAYQALGGELHQPTKLPQLDGWFYPPTLITGLDPSQTLDEIFGPVVTVHTFSDDDEAVEIANGAPYGLAAYVFGEERHCWQVARRIVTGITKINAVTMLNLNPMAPRPAWNLSGIGEEGTLETFEFFRGTRVIGVAGPNSVESEQ
ncbi:MAG: aldehyde dehydrogenase family protein [Pseudomonadales bacterium]